MNKEELVEFGQELEVLRRKASGDLFMDRLQRFVTVTAVIVPDTWSLAKEKAMGELLQLPTVRADVEKPGVLV